MKPTLPEVMETITWFASTLRVARDQASITLSVPPSVHIERFDTALRILGSLHVSPSARMILREMGFKEP